MKRCLFICIGMAFLFSCYTKNSDQPALSLRVLIANIDNDTLPVQQKINLAIAVDSICNEAGRDSLHLVLLKKIGTLYLDQGNYRNAENYFRKAIAAAQEQNDSSSLAASLGNLGVVFDETSKTDSAIKYYTEAGNTFYANKDTLHYAHVLVNTGILYKNKGEYEKAVKLSIEAACILEPLDSKRELSDAYTTLGNCMKSLNRIDDALQYHEKALKLRELEKDSVGIAGSLNNIGTLYRLKKEYPKALDNYMQSLAIKRKAGTPKTVAITLDNIGEVYLEQKKYTKAKQYFIKALELHKTAEDKDGFLTTAHRLCYLLLELNDTKTAEKIAREALKSLPETNSLKQQLDNAQVLMNVYKQSGKQQLAVEYATKSLALKDSVFNARMIGAISEMETKYKTLERERELVFAKKLQGQQTKQISLQKGFILLLTGIVLLLLIVSYLIYRLSSQRKRAKEKIELLMAELKHRVSNNLQVISAIQQLQLSLTKDPEQISVIEAGRKRVSTMAVIHRLLNHEKYSKTIGIRAFIYELIKSIRTFYIGDTKNIFLDIENVRLPIEKAIAIGMIVNELITNIYKHAQHNAESIMIDISFTEADNYCNLTIEDNGGHWDISQAQSNKKGLGLFIVEKLVAQLYGSWQSEQSGEGMIHTISFPNSVS